MNKMLVDIGIFAHNEAESIETVLQNTFNQDMFTNVNFSVRLHVLANGCTDDTARKAERFLKDHEFGSIAIVHDIQAGGKSRTWNVFVHKLCREEADFILFMDADIIIPRPDCLRGMVKFIKGRRDIAGCSSMAVKDIVHFKGTSKGPIDALIASASGSLNNWKDSICGQLYILRGDVARSIHMPIGLPVEDGYVRAMVQTQNFSCEGAPETRLDGRDEFYHVYQSERTISGLIKHQVRLVIGGAVNEVVFCHLRGLLQHERESVLRSAASNPDWIAELLKTNLPRRPHGYVPFHFLFKRLIYWKSLSDRFEPRRALVALAGFVFDATVYVIAQISMLRGRGAGYW